MEKRGSSVNLPEPKAPEGVDNFRFFWKNPTPMNEVNDVSFIMERKNVEVKNPFFRLIFGTKKGIRVTLKEVVNTLFGG